MDRCAGRNDTHEESSPLIDDVPTSLGSRPRAINTRRTVVAALQGVSDSDAEHLAAAFDIKSVKDLGTNKYFLWAQAVTKLAE